MSSDLGRLIAELLVVRASGFLGDHQRRYPRWELANAELKSLLELGVGGVILLGGSLLLTFLAIFVCLFYGLRRPPRSPAIIGFFLSFFIGVLVTATVFLQGIRAMAE